MNTFTKFILALLGCGIASAAGYEALPSNISKDKVTTAYNASEQVKGKYRLENAKLVREAKADPKDHLKIEVGNEENFKPKVKVSRWDEVDFSLELLDGESGNAKLETEGDKIKWSKGDKTARFYDLTSEEYPEGAFEFDIELKKKPKTNKIEFSLNTKGVEFFYQPALTQAEIDEGAQRPENVVGSYAVYASENKTNYVGGKEYKVGKIGHIYRPKIYDANGQSVWGVLNITGNILSVEIPQAFLDSAAYPVVVDPTFGYTTKGASQTGFGGARGNVASSSLHTATTGDTITGYSCYCYAGEEGYFGTINIEAYTVSSGAMVSRLGGPQSLSYPDVDSGNWTSITGLNETLANGSTYGIAIGGDDIDIILFKYDKALGTNFADIQLSKILGDSWSHSSYNTYLISIYATYTAGEGAARRVIITE